MNLTEDMKGVYTADYKTLLKEVKDTNKWKGILCSWMGRINIVEMSIPLKVIYRLSAIPFKTPMAFFFFSEIEILKSI